MNVPPALSNQNGVKRKVHTKKKKKGFITANVAGTKYEIGRKNAFFHQFVHYVKLVGVRRRSHKAFLYLKMQDAVQ